MAAVAAIVAEVVAAEAPDTAVEMRTVLAGSSIYSSEAIGGPLLGAPDE